MTHQPYQSPLAGRDDWTLEDIEKHILKERENHQAVIEEVDTHSRRAWALTSILMTYVSQGIDIQSKEVLHETLTDIWENLDAIGAVTRKGLKGV